MRCLLGSLALVLSMASLAPAGDVPDALIGRWTCKELDNKPVEFKKDGTCNYGWEKKDGEWVMVPGTFKMDGDRAVADISHGGVRLGVWWRLKDGHLESPKDAKPYIWRKDEKKEEKK